MKKSIVVFCIAMASFSNTLMANCSEGSSIKFPKNTEETVSKPASVYEVAPVSSFEDTIARDCEITESSLEIEDQESVVTDRMIAEDNQIIESTFTNVVYPLDFKKINRQLSFAKMPTQKPRLVGGL